MSEPDEPMMRMNLWASRAWGAGDEDETHVDVADESWGP